MTYLVLDGNFLCHRAWHALGGLSHGGVGTSVAFGLMNELKALTARFGSENFVFCFDHGVGKRLALSPGYKKRRFLKEQELTDEERAAKADFREQVERLKKRDLPEFGFRNVFFADGYEADDVIASVVNQVLARNELRGFRDDCVVVSADKDLYQLLVRNRVVVWNPAKKQIIDREWLKAHYGVGPLDWVMVKALAGCDGDDVIGIKGVGDSTAAKFIREEMNPESTTYKRVLEFKATRAYEKNVRLVRLPYPGCPKFTPDPDKVDKAKWNAFARSLGMTTHVR